MTGAATPLAELPAELPEKPTGWRQRLLMQMKFGKGSFYSYAVLDPDGRLMPICRECDSRPGARSGFLLPDRGDLYNWAALVAEWPAWLAEQKANASPAP